METNEKDLKQIDVVNKVKSMSSRGLEPNEKTLIRKVVYLNFNVYKNYEDFNIDFTINNIVYDLHQTDLRKELLVRQDTCGFLSNSLESLIKFSGDVHLKASEIYDKFSEHLASKSKLSTKCISCGRKFYYKDTGNIGIFCNECSIERKYLRNVDMTVYNFGSRMSDLSDRILSTKQLNYFTKCGKEYSMCRIGECLEQTIALVEELEANAGVKIPDSCKDKFKEAVEEVVSAVGHSSPIHGNIGL